MHARVFATGCLSHAATMATGNLMCQTLIVCALIFSYLEPAAAQGTWGIKIGTASNADPWPSAPDPSDCEFEGDPTSGHYAAAASSIWQEGLACHSKYAMACMGQPEEGCKDDGVEVEIIQECKSPCSADFLLTSKAFSQISNVVEGVVIPVGYRQEK